MLPSAKTPLNSTCLCGSGRSYSECCQPYHLGEKTPATAEQLMRSRYVAYALKLEDYLLNTWAAETRPNDLEFEADLEWIGLSIKGRKQGKSRHKEGWVTFVAEYRIDLEKGQLEERSYFLRNEQNNWCYLEGDVS